VNPNINIQRILPLPHISTHLPIHRSTHLSTIHLSTHVIRCICLLDFPSIRPSVSMGPFLLPLNTICQSESQPHSLHTCLAPTIDRLTCSSAHLPTPANLPATNPRVYLPTYPTFLSHLVLPHPTHSVVPAPGFSRPGPTCPRTACCRCVGTL
jgi:hypothetical protein